MRRGILALAGIGFAGLVTLAFLSKHLVTTVSGVEEAQALAATLRSAYASVLEPEPPLRVMRVPGSEAWPGFRWRVEGTVRASLPPKDPAVARFRERAVARALGTTIQGGGPSGVILVIHRAGAPDEEASYDRAGVRR